MKNQCRRCKCYIEQGIYCNTCFEEVKKQRFDKYRNRITSKQASSLLAAFNKVRDWADPAVWSSNHMNCFRASFSTSMHRTAESVSHIRKKFERWLYHRKLGRHVFTELRLKDGLGRPDLVVLCENGDVFCEEIVESEGEKSLESKHSKYPFEIRGV